MKKIIFLVLFFILFINVVYGATIYGNIYDISLDKVSDVIVEIDTIPKQTYVVKDGSYAFDVKIGDYTINANYYLDKVLESSAKEKLSVEDDETYRLDLILFPSFEEENALLNEIDFDIMDPYEEKPNYLFIVYVVLFIFVFLLLIYFLNKFKVFKKREIESEPDDYLDKILGLIKDNKRITQKDIRGQIPLSEAKISLIISELEHKGLIEKIKKGRGNILILKK